MNLVVAPDPVAREKLMRLQKTLLAMPQVEMKVQHYFADGLYAREIYIPKGVCLVGRVHLKSQVNIVSKGDISIMTEHGVKRIVAPYTSTTPAGVKRAGYAHEDTVWTTILATDKTDPQEIYDTLTALDFEQYEMLCRQAIEKKETEPCPSR